MKEYNGHRSWNAWNVSLWINNDESLYNTAVECVNKVKAKAEGRIGYDIYGRAARMFLSNTGLDGARTPDGARYNELSVKLALAEL